MVWFRVPWAVASKDFHLCQFFRLHFYIKFLWFLKITNSIVLSDNLQIKSSEHSEYKRVLEKRRTCLLRRPQNPIIMSFQTFTSISKWRDTTRPTIINANIPKLNFENSSTNFFYWWQNVWQSRAWEVIRKELWLKSMIVTNLRSDRTTKRERFSSDVARMVDAFDAFLHCSSCSIYIYFHKCCR